MNNARPYRRALLLVIVATVGALCCAVGALPQANDAGQSGIAKTIGKIKTISGNTLTLAPESGPEIPVSVQPNARLLRLNPGDKDLKSATPLQFEDLQSGDTVRVRGRLGADGKTINALEVLLISRSALDAVRDQIRQDWQKRGIGGLVKSVDPTNGTVTISVTGIGGKKDIEVKASRNTIIRRYAPDSVKFDDAKASTVQEIHAGDQLRARGEHSADGSQVTAEEIVTGSFQNIAGTVNSADASAGTVTVQDLTTKKPVTIKITAESQLHKLPPEFAQRVAMRLKARNGPSTSDRSSTAPANSHAQASSPEAAPGASGGGMAHGMNGMSGAGMGSGTRAGGAPDFQQMLSRMPPLTVSDLHKGDAVMIVATQDSTAITLLSGVEPILQAAPSGSEAMMLTPWSLGGGAPGGDAMQ
jgi:uncharacterized protein DUF5666